MKSILVADDDPDILALLVTTLGGHGYLVFQARDGQQAWQLILRERPDMAILDVNMPGIDGLELCQRIRDDARTREIGVMFLTGREEVTDKVAGFEAGADDYMIKPFQSRELEARVGAVLKRSEAAKGASVADKPAGKVIGFFGAKGGVGTSTIAVNVAVSLAQANNSVCLVDLDLEHAVSGLLMDVVPRRQGTIADLATSPAGGADWSLISGHLVSHDSGVKVLMGPTTPAHAEYVSGEHVKTFLKIMRRHNNYIVVDMSSHFSEINLDTFEVLDMLVLVVAAEVTALKTFRGATEVIQQLGVPNRILQVVLNQPVPVARLSLEDVKHTVKMPVIASLPYGGEEFVNSVNRGTPIVQMRPQNATSTAIKNLAKELVSKTSAIPVVQQA